MSKIGIARELWQKLGDIPINEYSEIKEDFTFNDGLIIFPSGTCKIEIWLWFEEAFDISVRDDLMFTEKL